MASTSSDPNTKMITTIKINSPNIIDLVFKTPIPSSFCDVSANQPTLLLGPSDPSDLSELFEKVTITREGFFKSYVNMINGLGSEQHVDLAMEIGEQVSEHGFLHPIVSLTGVIEEYAEAGKTKEALYVFEMMLEEEDCAPNVYTYGVIIKALAADKDDKFHGIGKELVMELMGKGMKPTASTYIAVFEAFARQGKMEEAMRFVEEMKGNGFVANRMAMRGVRRVLEAKGNVVQSVIDILFDKDEDYSDESEDNDVVKKHIEMFDWSTYPPESYVSIATKPIIEDDPENPKDLEHVFNVMLLKNGPHVRTMVRMLTMLKDDKFLSQCAEIMAVIEYGKIPEVMTHTGVMEIYGRRGEAKHALKVFTRMLSLGVTPNAYTYSALIKALAKDLNYLGDAKKYTLEMMEKGRAGPMLRRA